MKIRSIFKFMAVVTAVLAGFSASARPEDALYLVLFPATGKSGEELAVLTGSLSGVRQHQVLSNPDKLVLKFGSQQDLTGALPVLLEMTEVDYAGKVYSGSGGTFAFELNEVLVDLKSDVFEPLLKSFLTSRGIDLFTKKEMYAARYKVRLNKQADTDAQTLVLALRDLPYVKFADMNFGFILSACSNDPFFARQWPLVNTGSALQGNGTPDADMDVDSAWTITSGSASIKIGILDSGVDTSHNDLKPNLLPGYDAFGTGTNGYPTPNYPEDGHGTCCAGIAAAAKDNSYGVAGVAPSCKIIPVRTFYYTPLFGQIAPYSTSEAFSDAITWAYQVAGADVLSNSWGLPRALMGALPGGTAAVEMAIDSAFVYGRGGKGAPLFFSSGNDEDSAVIWPSYLSSAIAVNATNMCDTRKSASDCSGENWGGNYGEELMISAPGVLVASTDMRFSNGFSSGDFTTTFNGTSAACPNAAGVGALVLSVRPDLYANAIRAILSQSAEKVGGYDYSTVKVHGNWCREMGYGRVNAYNAVLLAQGFADAVETPSFYAGINIFPNPNTGDFVVHLPEPGPFELVVRDISGRVVKEQSVTEGTEQIQINSGLKPGMYVVEIYGKKQKFTGRTIISGVY